MTANMKDIAQALGVSVVTVSKVMRNHPDIGAETRERVLHKARELNYRPNLSARSLATGQSSQVGIIVPTLMHPFFAEVLETLCSVLKKSGYAVMIFCSMEEAAMEEAGIEQILGYRMDGLIIASCSFEPARFQQLQAHGTPFVLIDRYFQGFRSNFVGVDDFAVGRLATEHLISMGCRRIAHIRGLPFSTGVDRFAGYKDALEKHGLPFDPALVTPYMTVDGRDWECSYAAMTSLLQGVVPDGVFCYNDPIAIAAIDVAMQAGLRVPEDIAFIGCDNLHYGASLKAPLSSIDHHNGQIGNRAANMLIRLLKGKAPRKIQQVRLTPSLIIRESSCRRPPK